MKKRTKPSGSGRQRPADLPTSGELVQVSISARLDPETAEWLKGLKDKSAFLRAAINNHRKNSGQ